LRGRQEAEREEARASGVVVATLTNLLSKAQLRVEAPPPLERHRDPRSFFEAIASNDVDAQLQEAAELAAKKDAEIDAKWNAEHPDGTRDVGELFEQWEREEAEG
jgi:S-adenosylmethionine:diacylglycerol 3-amino-3-carboxypropyl transferase